jgi:hypothetical protein
MQLILALMHKHHFSEVALLQQLCVAFNRIFRYGLDMKNPGKHPQFKKPSWRHIIRNWKTESNEKLIALSILSRSAPDGWANVSKGEIKADTGWPDYRNIEPALARLKTMNKLQVGDSSKKSRMVLRLWP